MNLFRFKRNNRQQADGRSSSVLALTMATRAIVTEQKRMRKWQVLSALTKLFYIIVIIAIVYVLFANTAQVANYSPHTALINIKGVIADDTNSSAANINKALQAAFENTQVKGIILNINSPGGSPVQSGQVFNEIKRLRNLYPNTKIYSVINDIGASGAYYIAAATDAIYVHPTSLVGSIGVITSSFGFDKFIAEHKVTRRTMTAGDNKAFLDPFIPLSASHKEYWQQVLDETHKQFISDVKLGRGERLQTTNSKIFSGLIYTGRQSLENGLADEFGDYFYVAREVIQQDNIVEISIQEPAIDKLFKQLSARLTESIINSLSNVTLY